MALGFGGTLPSLWGRICASGLVEYPFHKGDSGKVFAKIAINTQVILPCFSWSEMESSVTEKEEYYICKLDGTNFVIWKEGMMDVLTNKGLLEPLFERQEGDGHTNAQWTMMDAKAKATIRSHLAESVFFTIMDHKTTKELWDSLCATWESKSASNKVFLMKKLFKLQMKEDGSITAHLNEFNSLFSQLTSKGLNLDDEMKTIFLLCSLPSSWDTFCMAINNSAPGGQLVFGDVTSSMLTEEIRRQSFVDTSKHGDVNVTICGGGDRRGHAKEPGKGGGNQKQGRSKSRDHLKNVECHYCHKKGHLQRDCFGYKRDQRKNNKKSDKGSGSGAKEKAKIEEINVVQSSLDVDVIDMGFPNFSKMMQVMQGSLLEVKAIKTKEQMEEALNIALDAVYNERSMFDGEYDPKGYLECYEQEMKRQRVPDVHMIVELEQLVCDDIKDQI
ncbi:hypothetical protein L7F22_008698 [Adiantum nelumboides]|nr:hypothetical protein [Adiantum nelumboides]